MGPTQQIGRELVNYTAHFARNNKLCAVLLRARRGGGNLMPLLSTSTYTTLGFYRVSGSTIDCYSIRTLIMVTPVLFTK